MSRRLAGALLVPAAFLIVVLVLGVPWWQIPYNRIELSNPVLWPGLALLMVLPALLVGLELARARIATLVMLGCMPAIDVISIGHDTAIDPTTHNLAPIEVVMMLVLGAFIVVPGVLAGVAFRGYLRRASA